MSILSLPFFELEETRADLRDLPKLAERWIAQYLSSPCVVLLQAEVGVGKTTLLQHLLSAMGVEPSHLVSPTFALHHILHDRQGFVHHHLDLYRVRSLHELEELELDAYLAKRGDYLWLEWAEMIPKDWLPSDRNCYLVHIELLPESQDLRYYRWQTNKRGRSS